MQFLYIFSSSFFNLHKSWNTLKIRQRQRTVVSVIQKRKHYNNHLSVSWEISFIYTFFLLKFKSVKQESDESSSTKWFFFHNTTYTLSMYMYNVFLIRSNQWVFLRFTKHLLQEIRILVSKGYNREMSDLVVIPRGIDAVCYVYSKINRLLNNIIIIQRRRWKGITLMSITTQQKQHINRKNTAPHVAFVMTLLGNVISTSDAIY